MIIHEMLLCVKVVHFVLFAELKRKVVHFQDRGIPCLRCEYLAHCIFEVRNPRVGAIAFTMVVVSSLCCSGVTDTTCLKYVQAKIAFSQSRRLLANT